MVTGAPKTRNITNEQPDHQPWTQASPDKSMDFHCATAASTVSLEPQGFVIIG
ncbi:hypothetical protein DBT_2448 [Dissulfuribacter thermophilus]|uniref:Uncharacterized protein n=1 Tax=Dissulfuribacter thermophilus TaxID=1156395 RepID=A0A1B9F2T6_9BACT|nr:hypothetical protein DBT_2448 [Dissulfuribacter thermophilus]